MSPDEVLMGLSAMGVRLSRVSLTRYEHQGLIPRPERGCRGGPGGVYTDYPPETVGEAYAAYCMLNGKYRGAMGEITKSRVTPEAVARIRQGGATHPLFAAFRRLWEELKE